MGTSPNLELLWFCVSKGPLHELQCFDEQLPIAKTKGRTHGYISKFGTDVVVCEQRTKSAKTSLDHQKARIISIKLCAYMMLPTRPFMLA